MTPLNVLYLVRTWAFGGSHTIVLLLMEHLPKERFNIICVPYDTHSGGDETFINAAEKRGLSVAPERIPWKSRSAFFKARDTIAELVKKYDIDLIHTHDPHSNVIAGLGRKRWPCACVASPYGWWNRVFPLRSHVYYHLERSVALRNFERVVTVSQTMKKKILGGGTAEDRVRVIHTGLDLRHLENGASRDATREQLGIPADAVVVGTVSRLYVEKGHSYLLKAAARLVPDFPKLHLLIVGSGPMKAELE
ncbi:MAG: glycosyltransferase, partial [Candidatus Hydrogenedentes bacterium]|nr:glycosyltransferase [Candidatus Hydrogenedentota bacterium]